MAVNDAPRHRDMILVGDARSWYADDVAALSAEYGLEIIRCSDVYNAVATLAQRPGRFCLVVGSLSDLGKERGTFYLVAQRRGVRCCCILDTHDLSQHRRIQTAVRAGVAIVAAASQLRALLEQWLADGRSGLDRRRADRRLKQEFQATEAELKALLGQEDGE
jgi:hypothetical protein